MADQQWGRRLHRDDAGMGGGSGGSRAPGKQTLVELGCGVPAGLDLDPADDGWSAGEAGAHAPGDEQQLEADSVELPAVERRGLAPRSRGDGDDEQAAERPARQATTDEDSAAQNEPSAARATKRAAAMPPDAAATRTARSRADASSAASGRTPPAPSAPSARAARSGAGSAAPADAARQDRVAPDRSAAPDGRAAHADGRVAAARAAAPLHLTEHTPLPEIADALHDLDDEQLRERRAQLTARLTALRLPRDVRLTIARQRDAVEWLQHQRQLARGEDPSAQSAAPTSRELSRAAPAQGANELELGARSRLESELRSGGAQDEQRAYLHLSLRGTPEQAAALRRQHDALGLESDAFRIELRATAARTAQEMLDASARELEGALTQYGLVGGGHRLTTAAQHYLRDPDALPRLITEWQTLSHSAERAADGRRGAAAQAALATAVAQLRAKQAHAEALEREERALSEADWMRRDAVDPSRNSLTARAELADAWLTAEAQHPALLAFRHPGHGVDADRLSHLTAAGGGMESAILEHAIPKLANILRTKHELATGQLDVLRMAPVLEVTKHKLLVPPGSQRAALVAELHREATQTSLAQHVVSALSLGLAVLSFVPGVGLGAKVVGEAASLALELHAQIHEYNEWRTAGGMSNTALDLARSVSHDAPGLRPLLLRLAVAGASAASLAQLGRLAFQLERAKELAAATTGAAASAKAAESATDVLRQLDALGEPFGVRRLGEQLDAVGGVRGAGVYAPKTFVKDGVERLSRLNAEKVRDALKKVAARSHLHGAQLDTTLAQATAEGTTATLKLPPRPATNGGAAQAGLEVHIELRLRAELPPSSAHGADAGPARLRLDSTTSSRWTVELHVDQHLEPRDLDVVLGHELDELAELARRSPEGKLPAGYESELKAGVMRQGATTARATAHDVANAREIVRLHRDYEAQMANPRGAAGRKETLDRAIEAAGLGDAAQIDAKVALLREAGASEMLLDRVRSVEARRVMENHSPIAGSKSAHVTEALIDHVIWPRGRSVSEFLGKGVEGGHHTRRLLDFAHPNSDYVFVEIASKPAAGSIARRFEQYKWNGGGAVPFPGSGQFPTDKNFSATGWIKSKVPKTTLDDPEALLREGEEAFQTFVELHPLHSIKDGQRTFSVVTQAGVEIGGYFNKTPAGLTPSTLFIEASWF
jgi:hypothetical protein